MSAFRSLNTYVGAPVAPDDIPDDALFLVEINRRVFRLTWAQLAAALSG